MCRRFDSAPPHQVKRPAFFVKAGRFFVSADPVVLA
jgi:hypothetical protein